MPLACVIASATACIIPVCSAPCISAEIDWSGTGEAEMPIATVLLRPVVRCCGMVVLVVVSCNIHLHDHATTLYRCLQSFVLCIERGHVQSAFGIASASVCSTAYALEV
jgi:hypothetical protein